LQVRALTRYVTVTAWQGSRFWPACTVACQADAAAAKAEIAGLLADPSALRPGACAAEQDLVMQRYP
jgi:hypothetical protein